MPRIAVIGAGLMGHGIAQVFALAGHDVSIYDSVAANLDSVKARILGNLRDLGDDQSAVERVRPTADLGAAVGEADYVVEAVLEDLPLKQKLFGEIERLVRPETILASNTSVIPITKIMQGLRDRSRALGTHWWNPPYLVPLVEVIETQWMFEDNERATAVRKGFLMRVPKGRLGEPSDLAGPLLFLASKASDFYTGHILYADGGYTAG